jgi:hypothetical protein
MRMSITAEQIAAIPGATNVLLRKVVEKLKLYNEADSVEDLLSKLIGRMSFNPYDWSRAHIMAMLTNDIPINNAVLYSPIKQPAILDVFVPIDPVIWPGGAYKDEEDVVHRLTYREYLRITEVEGGWVMQYAGGPKTVNNCILSLPTDAQLRAQITLGGGFLTQAEVDAIKISLSVDP